MKFRQILWYSTIILALTACANTAPVQSQPYPADRPDLPVEIQVIGDDSGALPDFPVSGDSGVYRGYVLAKRNERYRINIINRSGQRLGVVIAVDGRNIISGQKSYLRNNERMYVLNPYSNGSYEGWRSSQDQVNRFYFTQAAGSYAAAWGDTSAMGVIAVAVYPERPQPELDSQMMERKRMAPSASESAAAPGTGYGERTYSPTINVEFEPLPQPSAKIFLKYEWRETLCKKGILAACRDDRDNNANRFWPDNDGYAPPPPSRRPYQ